MSTADDRPGACFVVMAVAALVGCGGGASPGGALPAAPDAGPDSSVPRTPDSAGNAPDAGGPPPAEPPDAAAGGDPLAAPAVLAQRLARFLWGEQTADAALTAELSGVTTRAGVAAVARRMLGEPARARAGMEGFYRWWLRLDDLATLEKDDPQHLLTPALRASMAREAPAFGAYVILEGDGKFDTLLRAPYTFMDETLAAHYGLTTIKGPEMRQVPYGAPDRVGILGGAGVLTRFASVREPTWPARRYWLISEALLCESTILPPPSLQSSQIDPKKPIRAQMTSVTSAQMCQICHVHVNPYGFLFLRFDTFGRFIDHDVGGALDPTAVVDLGDGRFALEDQPDLMKFLSARPEARRCFTDRWMGYGVEGSTSGMGFIREPPKHLAASVDEALAVFEASGGDMRELIVAVAGSTDFTRP